MKALALTMMALTVSPLAAEGWIDYELLLKRNSNRVVSETRNGTLYRSLKTPDGVDVVCEGPAGKAACYGIDQSEFGAVGCTFSIANEARHLAFECPNFASREQTKTLERMSRILAVFVAENAVPAINPEQLDDLLAIKSWGEGLDCEKEGSPTGDIYDLMLPLVTLGDSADFEKTLGPPRLPVMNPCL